VKDALTENSVDWNNFNIPVEEKYFHQLKKKMLDYLGKRGGLDPRCLCLRRSCLPFEYPGDQ
jgi:hypothetical protein